MSAFARIGGSWKDGELSARIGGTWHPLSASVRVGGSWKLATAPDLTCAASPTALAATYNSDTGLTAETTVTPSGGTGPYTYAWARISGSPFIEADQPVAATTIFRGMPLAYPGAYAAIFQCTVTDSEGATATALVSVGINPE